MDSIVMRILIILAGVLALGFVGYLVTTIVRESPGNEKMREISHAIRQGAMAFLRREFTTLAIFTVVVFIILAVFIPPRPYVAIAYFFGTFTSA
ncbi:MAG TPA: sodium/proton-translocating pyrophosphatase, partial [Dehalococcoidales bacterium]|nr:sodium/proton-translocating pyrophosphatase [Dehalococcoidales bacterium]